MSHAAQQWAPGRPDRGDRRDARRLRNRAKGDGIAARRRRPAGRSRSRDRGRVGDRCGDRTTAAILITLPRASSTPPPKIVAVVREEENVHLLTQSGASGAIILLRRGRAAARPLQRDPAGHRRYWRTCSPWARGSTSSSARWAPMSPDRCPRPRVRVLLAVVRDGELLRFGDPARGGASPRRPADRAAEPPALSGRAADAPALGAALPARLCQRPRAGDVPSLRLQRTSEGRAPLIKSRKGDLEVHGCITSAGSLSGASTASIRDRGVDDRQRVLEALQWTLTRLATDPDYSPTGALPVPGGADDFGIGDQPRVCRIITTRLAIALGRRSRASARDAARLRRVHPQRRSLPARGGGGPQVLLLTSPPRPKASNPRWPTDR